MNDWLRRFLRGTASDHAADALAAERALHREHHQQTHGAFDAEQKRLAQAPGAVRLGRLDPSGREVLAAIVDLLRHVLLLGESGSGKTIFLLLLLLEVIATGTAVPLLIDVKGESVALLRERLLPRLLSRLSPVAAQALLGSLRVIDPFGSSFLPPFNVVVRDPSIAVEVQALDIASSLDTAIDGGSGLRMDTIVDWALRLLLEIPGTTLLTLRRALQEPALLDALVMRCTNADVRGYFLTRFPQEPQASKLAVLARLDRFLALPQTRLCLSAKTTLDFDAMLTSGVTLIDLGNAPAGQVEVVKFWATLIFTKVARAIYRRAPTGTALPAVIIVDEWQACLSGPIAASLEDVLARARSRGCFLWLANQQLAQLTRVSSTLREIALGQTTVQFFFRLAEDDARALRGALPPASDRAPSAPWSTTQRDDDAERRVRAATRLPNRTALFIDKRRSTEALRFRTASLDLTPITVEPAIAAALARGVVAEPVADLEDALREHDRMCDALSRGQVASAQLGAPNVPRKKRRGRGGPIGGWSP